MFRSSVSQPSCAGQAHREPGDAIAVTAGVRVLGVDRRGECPHDAAEEFGLLVVERDVAAVNAQDRGHAGHQAGFDRAELGFAVGDVAGAGVIEREQPAEVPVAFADRHGDDFADVRDRTRSASCRAAIEHERLVADAWTKPLHELPNSFRSADNRRG